MFVISADSQLWWFISYMFIALIFIVSLYLVDFNLYNSGETKMEIPPDGIRTAYAGRQRLLLTWGHFRPQDLNQMRDFQFHMKYFKGDPLG